MVVLKLQKLRINERGYLLLESLVTLAMIASILLLLYPLIVDWLVLREHEKEHVEDMRGLYEHSMQWPQFKDTEAPYLVETTDTSLTIFKNKQAMGVEIYEVEWD